MKTFKLLTLLSIFTGSSAFADELLNLVDANESDFDDDSDEDDDDSEWMDGGRVIEGSVSQPAPRPHGLT